MIDKRALMTGTAALLVAGALADHTPQALVHPRSDLREMWSIVAAHVLTDDGLVTSDPHVAAALRVALERRFGRFPVVFRGMVALKAGPQLADLRVLGVRDTFFSVVSALHVEIWQDGQLFHGGQA